MPSAKDYKYIAKCKYAGLDEFWAGTLTIPFDQMEEAIAKNEEMPVKEMMRARLLEYLPDGFEILLVQVGWISLRGSGEVVWRGKDRFDAAFAE